MRLSLGLFESVKKTVLKLKQQRKPVVIDAGDLREQFIRSAGPGGQNVNMRSSCVRLTHLPTGISVRCQVHREQALNRREALVMLRSELDDRINGECSMRRIKEYEGREKKRKRAAKSRAKHFGQASDPSKE